MHRPFSETHPLILKSEVFMSADCGFLPMIEMKRRAVHTHLGSYIPQTASTQVMSTGEVREALPTEGLSSQAAIRHPLPRRQATHALTYRYL